MKCNRSGGYLIIRKKRMMHYPRAVVAESRGRGEPDILMEPVIGLAAGETR
jgi:hypothetical protein